MTVNVPYEFSTKKLPSDVTLKIEQFHSASSMTRHRRILYVITSVSKWNIAAVRRPEVKMKLFCSSETSVTTQQTKQCQYTGIQISVFTVRKSVVSYSMEESLRNVDRNVSQDK